MNIPDAAIEAAAVAVYRRRYPSYKGDGSNLHGTHKKDARAAIEAAMPAIREAIAQEIEAAIENPSDDTVDAYHFDGLDEAARIVRGGAA